LQLSPKRLVTLYRITPAEARLAARLAALRTVEEASDDLGIAVSTARSQLKSVFAKTGTQSQSELLMMLATGALAHCSNA
jgi:DNA-binding CsgD family transcriptional regulator